MDALANHLTLNNAEGGGLPRPATARENQAASTLLQIPSEIRDEIYSYLFELCQARDDPKVINPFLEPDPSEDSEFIFTLQHASHIKICYQKSPPRYQLFPILQTCQLIRSEFQDFLRRTLTAKGGAESQGRGLRYELDVSAYKYWAVPVWATLPLPPEEPYNVIEELWVNYRVRRFQRAGGRFYGCGGPGPEPYTLFYLLSDFLFHGPQGFYIPAINDLPKPRDGEETLRYEGGRCNPKIKHLKVNVCFGGDINLKREALDAGVDADEPGAQEALDKRIRHLKHEREEATRWTQQNIWTMEEHGYFDGYVEKISIYHEGAEMSRGNVYDNDDEQHSQEPHFYTVDNGFNRSSDWKEDEEFVRYNFIWGPKQRFQKKEESTNITI